MSETPIIKKNFQERLKSDKPILYDGGFGSQLFARDIELANSALANELHPTDCYRYSFGLYQRRC